MNQIEIREAISAGHARFPGQKSDKSSVKGKKRNNEEEQLQCNCQTWNKFNEARLPILQWIYHCPNGGGRSKAESGILKAMGVKPGVPDFQLPFASGDYPGLAIELKSLNGRLSEDQCKWLSKSHGEGWCVAIVRDLEQYISVIDNFVNGKRTDILFGKDEIFSFE